MQSLLDRAADFFGLNDSKRASRTSRAPRVPQPGGRSESDKFGSTPTSPAASTGRFARKQTTAEAAAAQTAQAAADSSVLDEYARAQAVLIEAPDLDGGRQGLADIEGEMTCDADGDHAHGFIVVDHYPERPTGG